MTLVSDVSRQSIPSSGTTLLLSCTRTTSLANKDRYPSLRNNQSVTERVPYCNAKNDDSLGTGVPTIPIPANSFAMNGKEGLTTPRQNRLKGRLMLEEDNPRLYKNVELKQAIV